MPWLASQPGHSVFEEVEVIVRNVHTHEGMKMLGMQFDDMSSEKLFLYPYKVDFEEGHIPITQKVEYYIVNFEKKEPLKEELLHFIDCVKNRKTPRTDGEEGLRVLRVLESAEKSLMQ